jgi:feruloyl-CoA synthase
VSAAPRYRAVALGGSLTATLAPRADGAALLVSTEPLGPYPPRLTDRLLHWAEHAPDRTLAARRVDGGAWRHLSYAQALARARNIAQALLDRGLSAERPVAILSDNDLEHLLIGLGAMLAGVPCAPVSPAYSTVSQDFGKLRHVLNVLTPGLVYASSAAAYGRAIEAAVYADASVVLGQGRSTRSRPHPPPRRSTPRTPPSVPTPSSSSCSPRVRPGCPRA